MQGLGVAALTGIVARGLAVIFTVALLFAPVIVPEAALRLVVRGAVTVFGTDKAILAGAYEILAVRGNECFSYKRSVFGLTVLQKRAL